MHRQFSCCCCCMSTTHCGTLRTCGWAPPSFSVSENEVASLAPPPFQSVSPVQSREGFQYSSAKPLGLSQRKPRIISYHIISHPQFSPSSQTFPTGYTYGKEVSKQRCNTQALQATTSSLVRAQLRCARTVQSVSQSTVPWHLVRYSDSKAVFGGVL